MTFFVIYQMSQDKLGAHTWVCAQMFIVVLSITNKNRWKQGVFQMGNGMHTFGPNGLCASVT